MGCAQLQAGQNVLTPLDFPGLILWNSAERIAAAGTSAIDLSGNARDALFVNVTVVAGVVNGRPVFRFNGVNAQFAYPNNLLPGLNYTAFLVLKCPNAVAAASQIGWVGVGGQQQVLTANGGVNTSCFDNINHPTSNLIDDFSAFSALAVSSLGGSCTFYQNLTNIGNPVNLCNVGLITNFAGIGAFFSAQDVAELLFYSTTLSANQVAVVMEYFRERYNLY